MGELHRDEFRAGQYFVAVAGMAMMRRILARPSEGLPRLEDVRRVLDSFDEFPNDILVEVVEHDLDSGYERWAPSYDGRNPLIEAEEPVVRPMLDALPRARALDAACGTGRHAGYLAGLGHDTIGVDANAAMLRVARERFPAVDFKPGRLEALPVEDGTIDVVKLLDRDIGRAFCADRYPGTVYVARSRRHSSTIRAAQTGRCTPAAWVSGDVWPLE